MTSDDAQPTSSPGHVPDNVLAAAVLPSFSPLSSRTRLPDAMRAPAETAVRLQMLADAAPAYEMRVLAAFSAPRQGATTELLALLASAGEQFGNAVTACLEGQRWLLAPATGGREVMGARAMADDVTYRLLSVSHNLVNAALRTLHLFPHFSVRPTGILAKAVDLIGAAGNDQERDAWLSMNPSTTERLLVDAQRQEIPAFLALAQPLNDLANTPRWESAVELRHNDYHRRRAMSLPGGISAESPWSEEPGDGERATGFDLFKQYTPPDPRPIVDDAEWALLTLGLLIDKWLDDWESSMAVVNEMANAVTHEEAATRKREQDEERARRQQQPRGNAGTTQGRRQ